MMKKKFPTLAVILLITALTWLLNEMELIALDVPWIPLILIIIAIGMIVNRYSS
jgi:hypothetical protein